MRDTESGLAGCAARQSPTLSGGLFRLLLGISPREVTFARRGFRYGRLVARRRLERIGAYFLHGYHAALIRSDPWDLASELDTVGREDLGFAYEGAAMGIAVLDHLWPWRVCGRPDPSSGTAGRQLPWTGRRLEGFMAGPGSDHIYMTHVGVGWALARLRLRIETTLARLDTLLRWLAVDGYGFHEGYFHWRRSVAKGEVPRRVVGYARRAFDQGLGRSLWFVEGADVPSIAGAVRAFDRHRWADLWSGVGLAAAYAGGAEEEELGRLKAAAGPYGPALAQGAAFAAKARQRSGTPAGHTGLACRVFCGLDAGEAAFVTDAALEGLPESGPLPSYEIWRRRIQSCFT